jgi:hypothetical protein
MHFVAAFDHARDTLCTCSFRAISFSHNIASAIFGRPPPVVVTWLLRFDRLAPAHYVGALCLLGTGIGVFMIARASTYKIVKDE